MRNTLRRILFTGALVAVFTTGVIVGQNKFGQPKSIIHVVQLKWKDEATPEQRQKAIDGIKEMAAAIPGIKNVWLKSTRIQLRTADEKAYEQGFAIEFADEAAAKAYADHPAHAKWTQYYESIRAESRSAQITN